MGFLKFEDLLKEYVSHFEKNYSENENHHPTFSILRTTYWNLAFYYYFINVLFILIAIIAIIPILLNSIKLILYLIFKTTPTNFGLVFMDAYLSKGIIFNHLIVIGVASSIGIIGLLFFIKCLKFPKVNELWVLGDRITLIRGRIQYYEFDLQTIKEMILNTNNIYGIEAEAHLERYYQLVQPIIDGNKNKIINKESDRLERLIAFDLIMKSTNIKYSQKETTILLSSLLMIGKTDLGNVRTNLNFLDKMIRHENISLSEEKRKEILSSLKKTTKLLEDTYKKSSGIYNSLVQSK